MSSPAARTIQVRPAEPRDDRLADLQVAVAPVRPDPARCWRAVLHDFEMKLPCQPQTALWARSWLCSIDVPLPAEEQEHLRLLAHELLRNSVEHSGSNEMTIKVEVETDAVRVVVTDDGSGADLTPRDVDAFSSSGRGLRWVEHLADAWGIDRNGHTAVWFEMKRDEKAQPTGSGATSVNS